jgi:hypothetical protein
VYLISEFQEGLSLPLVGSLNLVDSGQARMTMGMSFPQAKRVGNLSVLDAGLTGKQARMTEVKTGFRLRG